jgi:hypothetical protein
MLVLLRETYPIGVAPFLILPNRLGANISQPLGMQNVCAPKVSR